MSQFCYGKKLKDVVFDLNFKYSHLNQLILLRLATSSQLILKKLNENPGSSGWVISSQGNLILTPASPL